jgi:hypothetical protein
MHKVSSGASVQDATDGYAVSMSLSFSAITATLELVAVAVTTCSTASR